MSRGWRHKLIPGVLGATSVIAGGCASLDPTRDIQKSRSTVEQRTGLVAAWEQGRALHGSMAAPRTITSRDAAMLALRNDRKIRSALERIAEARADLVQSGLLPNPVLALDLGFPIDGSGGASKIGVSLTEQLVSLLTRSDRMNVAAAHLDEQVLATSDLALRTVADAKAAHARVVFTQRAITPLRESIISAEEFVQAAGRRVVAGEDTSLEVNRQRLALLRLQAELARRETDLELRKRELLARMGVAEQSIEFEAVLDAASTDPLAALSEEGVMALVASERLDIAAATAAADASRARVRAESGGRIDFGAGPAFERTDDGRKELGASLNISVPIFDTGDARVAKALAEANRLALDAEQVQQDAVAEARAAFINARAARDQARRYESEIVTLAGKNMELAQKGFGAGQADLTVLLEARQALVDAHVGLIDQQMRAALAMIELERAVGGRLAVTR